MILRAIATSGLAVFAMVGPCTAQPITRIATIDLPGVKGRIDHLSADPAHHRLFVAALGNDTVEVVDTVTSEVRTIRGMREPQGLLYVPNLDRLVSTTSRWEAPLPEFRSATMPTMCSSTASSGACT